MEPFETQNYWTMDWRGGVKMCSSSTCAFVGFSHRTECREMDRFVDYVRCLCLLVFTLLLDTDCLSLDILHKKGQHWGWPWHRFFGVSEQYCTDLQRATEGQEDTSWTLATISLLGPCSGPSAGWPAANRGVSWAKTCGLSYPEWLGCSGPQLDMGLSLRGADSKGERLPDTSFILDWTRQRKTEPSWSRSQPGVKTHAHMHPHTDLVGKFQLLDVNSECLIWLYWLLCKNLTHLVLLALTGQNKIAHEWYPLPTTPT